MSTGTSKSAAAKKTAATKAQQPQDQPEEQNTSGEAQDQADENAGGDTGQSSADQAQADAAPNRVQNDSGPGTGQEAPPERHPRYPSTVVNSDASPLDPPADTHTQVRPLPGHAASTPDMVYAEAGGRTVAGEDHVGLVDADGESVSIDGLFDDDPRFTYVIANQRVFEEFYYPNTTEKARRLLFVKGQRLPRYQAERIKATVAGAPEASEEAAQPATTNFGVRQEAPGL